jgi:hypothetical protein
MQAREIRLRRISTPPPLIPAMDRRDTMPHPGHTVSAVQVLAWIRTDLPARNTRSIVTSRQVREQDREDIKIARRA